MNENEEIEFRQPSITELIEERKRKNEAKKKKNTKNETIYRYRSRSRNPYRVIINYFYINHNIEGKNNCYFIKLKSNIMK